jgi:hypothetical protein
MDEILSTVSGFSKSYDRTATIMLLDTLNTILMEYKEGSISRDDAVTQMYDARNYTELPLKRGGFVTEDVEKYIDDLINTI